MIKKNNKDVGFILKGTQNIDKIYHGTDLVFEQGFLREDEGTTPLTTSHEAIGKDLKDYVIYGNSVQNGTPTPDNPIEIQSVGDKTENVYDYTDTAEVTSGITVDSDGWISVEYDNTQGQSTKYFNFTTNKLSLKPNTIYSVVLEVKSVSGTGRIYPDYSTQSQVYNTDIQYFIGSVEEPTRNIHNGDIKISTSTTTADIDSYVSGCNTLIYFLAGQSGSVTFRISIIEGISITENNFVYEPYGYRIPVTVSDGINSSTTNIYLKEPLRKIGDYADYIDFKNSKVVRNLGYLVFTRTTINTAYDSALSATLEFNLSNSVHFSPILSNRAVRGGINTDSNIGQARIYNGVFQVRVKYPDGITKANTKAEKKAAYNQWLSNNNIDLIYCLNTPTEETIELPDIPTLKGTTIFEVDTTVQPSNIKVIYKGK